MVCLGLEPRVAGWKAQTNPLSYGGRPKLDNLKKLWTRMSSRQHSFKELEFMQFTNIVHQCTLSWRSTCVMHSMVETASFLPLNSV